MASRKRSALGFPAVLALVACGQSSSSDDDGAAGAPGGGADCDSDAECTDPGSPKCSRAGECVNELDCETDADCRGEHPICDAVFHQCQACRVDADCPSGAPECVQHWEGAWYCAECEDGDSSRCAAGTWCTTDGASGGGACEAPGCAAEPMGLSCLACKNENAADCLGDGGECTEALADFHACYERELPGWTEADCPTGTVPSMRGCTPLACSSEADAFDACLLGCAALVELCGG